MTCSGAPWPLRSSSAKPAWMTRATAASLRSMASLISRCDCATLTTSKRLLEVKREIKLAAFLRMVEIEHDRRDVVDLEGGRIAEQQHLHDRRHDQAETGPFVALELDELLDHDRDDAREHGCQSRRLAEGACRQQARPRARRATSNRIGVGSSAMPDAFQEHRLEDGDVVARVDQIGDVLDRPAASGRSGTT